MHSVYSSKRFFTSLFYILLLLGCAGDDKAYERSQDKPHIVLLLIDDMGYGDVGAYNEDSKIPTPHIDVLAGEGMRFTDAHAPGAVCHPSRYGLLTGRYPFRTDTGVWPEEPVIAKDRMTIASLLKTQGYRTAMVGKWHLGFDESHARDPEPEGERQAGANTQAAYRSYDPEQPLTGGPVDRGFDHFFGIRASTDIPPYFYIRGDRIVSPPTDTIGANSSAGWSPIQGAFWRAGGIAPNLKLAKVLPRFTEEAQQVIEQHSKQHPAEPMMLYLALPAPHTPWLPAEEYQGRSAAGLYGDFTAMVDAQIGQILTTLEQAGMAGQTLVVFTSDNGPVWYGEDTRRFGHDSQGGLRGMKGDAWEAGHRMPFIVRWPGIVEPGSVSEQTISFTDLMATLADIVGAELPDEAGEDSFSLLPVLSGVQPEDDPIRPPVVSVSSRGVRSIQDGSWKLIEALGSGGFSEPVRIEPDPEGPQGQLYDIGEDRAETTNLWNVHPEVVERLQGQLEELDRSGRSRPKE